MADRKDRSHTYVLDRQFNGRQKRVNYLHTTQKSYIRAGQTTTQKSYIRAGQTMADRKELSLHRMCNRQFNGRQKRVNYLHTTQKSYIRAGQTIQWPTEKSSTIYTEVIHTCRTDSSTGRHRSHTYVLDRQFNGRQKRVNYLHTTQKSYIRAGQTIQWPTEKS